MAESALTRRVNEFTGVVLFAAALIDRTEVHQHPAIGIVTVTNAHDDHIAFIALHIFQVLYEQLFALVQDLVTVLVN